jgi:hypothetical protein
MRSERSTDEVPEPNTRRIGSVTNALDERGRVPDGRDRNGERSARVGAPNHEDARALLFWWPANFRKMPNRR